jgi:hypothetical protein
LGSEVTLVAEKTLSSAVDEAIKCLISVEHFHAGTLVSVPVMYPSGASVVLEIFSQKDRVYVSDRGGAHQEAEFLGATRTFGRDAQRVAVEAGIKFDGRDMFVAEIPFDRIAGAMTVVADCSARAAALCAIRAAERDEKDAKDALFERLSDVFGPTGFERDVQMIGASNHKWRVDAVVMRPHDSPTLFNSVTRKYVSAAGTAAKFHDFARLETTPRRIAVVTNTAEIGDWIGVIASASDAVIELKASNDQFYRVGMAA